jgi:DNA-binding transcriptional LysR family regulator
MDLRQLEYLVAVAEEANFTRAAHRTHVSQPGLSSQLRRLEAEVGATLVDRSARPAALTAAGKAAVEHARTALASVAALRQAVDELNGLLRGQLVVGMVTACTLNPLFHLLARFHQNHPAVQVTLVEDHTDRLIERVRAGAADLALVGTAGDLPGGLDSRSLAQERLVAAVPPTHPLARRQRINLTDLCAHPLVCMPSGTGIRTAFDQACAHAGLSPTVAFEASAPGAIAELARRGLGVAVLSESMPAAYGLHPLAIPDADVTAGLALIWRSPASPALHALLRHDWPGPMPQAGNGAEADLDAAPSHVR